MQHKQYIYISPVKFDLPKNLKKYLFVTSNLFILLKYAFNIEIFFLLQFSLCLPFFKTVLPLVRKLYVPP